MISATRSAATTATPAASAPPSTTSVAGALGKQDFLKLLISQLRNQDPMNPMQDRDFITQLAQFSSLEALNNLNQQLDATSRLGELNQASSLIGKDVEIATSDSTTTHGIVTEIHVVGGTPRLVIGTYEAQLADIVSVKGGAAQATSNSTDATA